MADADFNQMIADVVDGVLETMFFTAPAGTATPEPDASGVLHAGLAFRGCPSGNLAVHLSKAGAQMLAANFLGEDEETLTESQLDQVTCELANMLCGSVVSRLESGQSFDLAPPELIPAWERSAPQLELAPAAQQSFLLENGNLTVTLFLETAT